MLRTIKLKQSIQVECVSRMFLRFQSVLIGREATKDHSTLSRESDVRKLQFNDGRLATESKSLPDILRALFILKLCTIDTLVDNSEKVL